MSAKDHTGLARTPAQLAALAVHRMGRVERPQLEGRPIAFEPHVDPAARIVGNERIGGRRKVHQVDSFVLAALQWCVWPKTSDFTCLRGARTFISAAVSTRPEPLGFSVG